jgi:hypothetical protein
VAWFGRRGQVSAPSQRRDRAGELEHLEQFVRSRVSVEAYLEPRTTVTENTVILIAADGEWTRRRVANPVAARQWARRMGIPFYDVHLTGYPQRMRDYNARRKALDAS